jgi:uncharacterized protein Yka (UPF0111/DUF47 family)
MLKKLIRKIIPNNGEVFFNLFVEGAQVAHEAANVFTTIINARDLAEEHLLSADLRIIKQKAQDVYRRIMIELNNQFITPLDRGDIQELAVLLMKLTNRVIKTNNKLQIYGIDTVADDCLSSSTTTLQSITKVLVEVMVALKSGNSQNISFAGQRTDEFDENGIDDLQRAMTEMYSGNYDTLTILKLKEIYKGIEGAIDTSANIADLVMQITVKEQ